MRRRKPINRIETEIDEPQISTLVNNPVIILSEDDDLKILTNLYIKEHPKKNPQDIKRISGHYASFLASRNMSKEQQYQMFKAFIDYIAYRQEKYPNESLEETVSKFNEFGRIMLKNKKYKLDFWIELAEKKKHECCICYENNVSKLLACKHSVCQECTTKITNYKCPICRAPLAGGYFLGEDAEITIMNQRMDNLRDHLTSLLHNSPNFYPYERYFYTLPTAFIEFVTEHPTIQDTQIDRIFESFIQFFITDNYLKMTLGAGVDVYDSIRKFKGLGELMILDPTL